MSEINKTPTFYVAMAEFGKFIENYGRPGDILTREEIYSLLGLQTSDQSGKDTEDFNTSKKSLETVGNNFLEAFRKFEEAKKELRLATGWSFKMTQTIISKEEDASLRDDLVTKINLISKEFNTK